ncbi:tRNA 2-thiouridine(34) synthase MnmA [Candidatus Uhrbacteria bacterium]|nr:tRNA 2-thiouridine(34) synthase MnmA [Candidatus Uhrbacteria bacterium]
MTKKKVLLGMSGGVDSSVSAVLLLEAGYEVIGAFMKNWSGGVNDRDGQGDKNSYIRKKVPQVEAATDADEAFTECDWKAERRDAARVAAKLDIPFVTFDFEKEYRARVVENMFEEFQAGRTPNPDVLCNKSIKFDRFVQEADRLGCAFVATGHYARVQGGQLLAGSDKNKDQSYFLWAIKPEVLARVLFPVGEMRKPEVRERARQAGLSVAGKKDSTGICFVGEVEMRAFLQERIPKDPGNIVTTDGKLVGVHEGLAFYTIGQRHGLRIGGGEPYYVVDKRPATKELVVGSNFHPALFKRELRASQLNWFQSPTAPRACQARIRYRQPLQSCTITQVNARAVAVVFDEPQRAVTPGQSVVFYDGEVVLGGGIIK